MGLTPHYVPVMIQKIFPSLVWSISTNKSVVYLTFDDGPILDITPFILDSLRRYDAKATFFCVGENIVKHQQIFDQIIKQGHAVGNHTQHHLKAWKTSSNRYMEDIVLCQEQIDRSSAKQRVKIFRPPYGQIHPRMDPRDWPPMPIIMWSVLSCDYDSRVSPETCLHKTIRYTKPGSIVVFHDNIKAWRNLSYALPRYLDHFSSLGYRFEALDTPLSTSS